MKYIAYGSNLNLDQMKYRCPGAKPLYKGTIKNYTLVFRGSKTGAYATIIPEKGQSVPVLVWEIDEDDEKSLDIYEGFPTFYYKKDLEVTLGNNHKITAMAYIMFDAALPGQPSDYYIKTCLKGYADNDMNEYKFMYFVRRNQMRMRSQNKLIV